MRILLTGSSGWLGRYLAPRLVKSGHEVVGLDVAAALPSAAPTSAAAASVEVASSAAADVTAVVGSVADPDLVDRVFDEYGIEAVIHAAALHKPDIARHPSQAFVDVNVTGTLNLLEAAVRAGNDRFVFTSTTSLMISEAIRAGTQSRAVWLDEDTAPLEPRNIYGVTKLSAEHLCRLFHLRTGLPVTVLRTARFFPEDDDTLPGDGRNLKANEFLHRRLTVEDAAEAHVAALTKAPDLGFETFIASAPTPFHAEDCGELIIDAPLVIARYFPDAAELYAARGWQLPQRIDRVYASAKAERLLAFRCRTDFATILDALRNGTEPPILHDPAYTSPALHVDPGVITTTHRRGVN